MRLSLSRHYSEIGPQPLSYSDIASYVSMKNIDTYDELEDFFYYIQVLDDEFIVLSQEKIKKAQDKLRNRPKGGKTRGTRPARRR